MCDIKKKSHVKNLKLHSKSLLIGIILERCGTLLPATVVKVLMQTTLEHVSSF